VRLATPSATSFAASAGVIGDSSSATWLQRAIHNSWMAQERWSDYTPLSRVVPAALAAPEARLRLPTVGEALGCEALGCVSTSIHRHNGSAFHSFFLFTGDWQIVEFDPILPIVGDSGIVDIVAIIGLLLIFHHILPGLVRRPSPPFTSFWGGRFLTIFFAGFFVAAMNLPWLFRMTGAPWGRSTCTRSTRP
jgi:hypothetical protein